MEQTFPATRQGAVTHRAAHAAHLTGSTVLAGEHLRSTVTAAGAGTLTYAGMAVIRGDDDPLQQTLGAFLYLRDLDSGRVWSAGWQPTAAEPEHYTVDLAGDVVTIQRVDDGIASLLEVAIVGDVEMRQCTLLNLSDAPRRIEATSYLEWVLQEAAADSSHPAFSKLFVETHVDLSRRRIMARRRRRSPEQRILSGVHAVVEATGEQLAPLSFETSRTAFIGRGRNLRSPRALDSAQALAGSTGAVLDPIACWRFSFCLPAGESATISLATAARETEEQALAAVDAIDPVEFRRLLEQRESRAALMNGESTNGDATSAVNRRVSTIVGSGGDLYRVDPPHDEEFAASFARWRPSPAELDAAACNGSAAEELQFDNGLGGFTADGKEYVLRLRPDGEGSLALPPQPWVNIVANEDAGFIATETGAGYAWTANSRENRLTHWHNDPVIDPHSEAFYLRDLDSHRYWSPLPGPAGAGVPCEVRHGRGYTEYRQECAGLRQQATMFVPPAGPVKLTRLVLENCGDETRRLDFTSFAEWALGNGTRESAGGARAWFDEESNVAFATNARRELAQRVAFAALVAPATTSDVEACCDPAEFIGPLGDLAAPQAICRRRRLQIPQVESGPACAALQTRFELAPGEQIELVVLLGEAETEAAARQLVAAYRSPAAIESALTAAKEKWRRILSAVEIDTPSQPLNLMINGWLPYQNLSCRIWARSAYYQAGGAYGFRDQLQDAAAYMYHLPELTRAQIVRHASHQFVEGDVLHWWHPPFCKGLRTRFADDLLWLPMIAAEYVTTTGDEALWDESAPFLAGPDLDDGEDERFLQPGRSGECGSIYEHCCRAIDRSLAVGDHCLPLMGCGDWNDGMNRIGHGRGESVWMGFFLTYVINRMLPVCQRRGDQERAGRYAAHRELLRTSLNDAGWDGQWYRRAFFDDGTPVGSINSPECKIDALAQAWAVMSGAAPEDRAAQALRSVDERLVRRDLRMVKLLDPPFDCSPNDPGYIQGYVPGVRENGGQYTHGVLWYIRALAEAGQGTAAAELLEMLTPIRHGDSPDIVARYQAEPYVVAADVYGQAPHEGRAGWTWYTGSAGWMFRVAVESILGLGIEGGRTLVMNPSIAADWPTCRLTYRPDDSGTEYEVTIDNPHGRQRGVTAASCDGEPAPVENGVARIPLVRDGRRHVARIEL